MPSNAIPTPVNMHDTMIDNTEMLKVMLGNTRRLDNFLFDGDREPAPKDDNASCMMDEAIKQQALLKMCLDTMATVFDKLGTNG